MEYYVHVRIGETAYKLTKLTFGISDPSLYFHFRMGQTERSRKLSYHPTGTVKQIHLAPIGKQYFEPLSAITRVNHFLSQTLDTREMTPSDDTSNISSPTLTLTGNWPALGIAVTPPNSPEMALFDRIEIPCAGFSIVLFDLAEIPHDLRREGCYAFAHQAHFSSQQMEEGPSELAYMQLASGTTSPIIQAPNGEHYRTVYHSPMAREPDLIVKGLNRKINAHIAEDRREAHKFSFRLSTKSGVIKDHTLDNSVEQIFLNARLRMPDRE